MSTDGWCEIRNVTGMAASPPVRSLYGSVLPAHVPLPPQSSASSLTVNSSRWYNPVGLRQGVDPDLAALLDDPAAAERLLGEDASPGGYLGAFPPEAHRRTPRSDGGATAFRIQSHGQGVPSRVTSSVTSLHGESSDWNARYQFTVDLPEDTPSQKQAKLRRLTSLATDFVKLATHYGETM